MEKTDDHFTQEKDADFGNNRSNGHSISEIKGSNSSGGELKTPGHNGNDSNDSHDLPERGVEYELKKLSFKNPGKFMEDFVPARSRREMRKMNRKCYTETCRNKNQLLYDESGISLETNQDMCDCLDGNCPGCHFPCPKCGSEKCGTECRCSRKWAYDQVHVEGTNIVLKWPT